MIFQNMVLVVQVLNNKEEVFRVIWLDGKRNSMYLIKLFDSNAKPFKCGVSEYEGLIKTKYAKVIEDPTIKYTELTSKAKELWNKRIFILERLEEEFEETELFDMSKIWKGLLKLENELGCSANFMKKVMRTYWQNGMNYNALIPVFGRKRIKDVSEHNVRLPLDLKEQGGEWKETILLSYERFYRKNSKATLTSAYEDMIEHFFSKKIEYSESVQNLSFDESYPSYWQFEYHTRHLRFNKETLSKRWGENKYQLKGREILGVTQEKVYGPGSLFQIDATIADIFVVSSINRQDIIGRPILYFVTDSFSRMITGVYCGLEGPSWNGAMMALVNSASDKVRYCEEYGLSITKEDWPCCHIPDAIRGDRGELSSANAEEMVRLQGIDIENTPPFRADLKGIVERMFGIIQGRIKPLVPGYIDKDYRVRGAKDYRLEAELTLKEFTKIIILEILDANRRLVKGYRKPKDLLADKIPAQPIRIWNWGLQNRSGALRSVSEKEMKLTLMPCYEALVTAQGLKYCGLFYTNTKAIREEWFSRARVRGSWKIKVRVDSRSTNHIYYWDEITNDLEIFELVNYDRERYSDLSFEEVSISIAYENYRDNQLKKNLLETKINKNAMIREITTQAKEETAKSRNGISKAKKVAGIRDKRLKEKAMLREQESFNFNEKNVELKAKETDYSDIVSTSKDKENILDILDEFEKQNGW